MLGWGVGWGGVVEGGGGRRGRGGCFASRVRLEFIDVPCDCKDFKCTLDDCHMLGFRLPSVPGYGRVGVFWGVLCVCVYSWLYMAV